MIKCTIIFVKKQLLWIWKVLDHNSKKLLGWQRGDRSSQTLTEPCDHGGYGAARKVYSDNYACYGEVIGAKRLRQSKRNTYKIEQNNALQRHWIDRFRRRTQIVSKSVEMSEMTIALFARFRVNVSIQELLSLLR